MRRLFRRLFLALILLSIICISSAQAQSPQGKNFGFGIVLGEPTGGTLKFWTQRPNAIVVNIGSSYFGNLRIGADYLWHFDAFNSDIAFLYAGPGAAIGFGEGKGFWYKGKNGFYFRENKGAGLGVRGVFGVNVVPQRIPLEFFFEVGALIGIVPDFGSAVDAALGMRFYP